MKRGAGWTGGRDGGEREYGRDEREERERTIAAEPEEMAREQWRKGGL